MDFNDIFFLFQEVPTCPVSSSFVIDGVTGLVQRIGDTIPKIKMPAIRGKKGWCGCLQVRFQFNYSLVKMTIRTHDGTVEGPLEKARAKTSIVRWICAYHLLLGSVAQPATLY